MLRLVEDVRTWWIEHLYFEEGIILNIKLKHLFELIGRKEKFAA
jgi:hypothetical protein